jgi:hypothetical protein
MNKKSIITKMESLKGAINNLSGKIDEVKNNQFLSAEGKKNELETLKFNYDGWYGAYYDELKTIADNLLPNKEAQRAELEVKLLTDPGYQAALQNTVKLFESGALAVSTGKALIDHYKNDRTVLSLLRNALGDIFGNGNPNSAELAQYIPADNSNRTKDLLNKFAGAVDELNYKRLMEDPEFVKQRVDGVITFLESDYLDDNMDAIL